MEHMKHISEVLEIDKETIEQKEATYGGSWKKRDAGVFHMIARMWDRVENITESGRIPLFDVIRKEEYGNADGQMLAILADMRRYLTLIEAQMRAEAAGDPSLSHAEWRKQTLVSRESLTPSEPMQDEINTEQVNDIQPCSVVPPDWDWLMVAKHPMVYQDFYRFEPFIGGYTLLFTVGPEQYKRMPHNMQALYEPDVEGFKLTKEAIKVRQKKYLEYDSTSAL